MAAEHQLSTIPVAPEQPLIGVVFRERGRDLVRYFTNESEADAALPQGAEADAMRVIGAWSDLDWDEAAASLDQIRHQTPPTPPISL